jgi:hypothetical protein
MSLICPLLKQPCIRQDCEMWLSTEIDNVDHKGNHIKELNFEDCAFRIIAGRPRYNKLEKDPEEETDSGSMTGN